MILRIVAVIAILSISGCVSRTQIMRAEQDATIKAYSATSMTDLLNSGLQAGQTYLRLSDRAASAQDAAFIGLLAIASAAAVGVVDGTTTNELAYAGIAGLAVNQTASYYDPKSTGTALLLAAERQFCIVETTRTYGLTNQIAMSIVRSAYNRNRIRLRQSIERELPSYEALLADLKMELRNQNSFTGDQLSFQSAINACFGVSR